MPAPRTIDAVIPFKLPPTLGAATGFEASTSCDRATPVRLTIFGSGKGFGHIEACNFITLDEAEGLRDWLNEVLAAAKTPEPSRSRVVPQPPMTERDWQQANLDEDAARTATESW
ncbi:hypothetical protein [Xanthobacter flavus]|uniref:hypothetical protein n=1 Tax=Xanthobacter flavus TaxID=281 RepID=UPI003728B2EA